MKKLLLLLMVASFGIAGTATAQKNSKKNCDNNNKNHSKKYDRNDNDRYDNDRYERNDRNDRNGSYDNKYSTNTPRKVRDAFERDYPNASNVSWTKDRGVWTASFKKGGLFGGTNSVSYQANGQRVGNNNNGVYGRNNNDRTARTNTQQGSSIFDKIKNRQ